MLFLFNDKDKTIDTIESNTALRNIKSKENDEGRDSLIPLIVTWDWLVCMYIAAKAGPIELPTILSMLLIPIVTPEYCLGELRIIIFMAPTAVKERPADKIPKPIEINNSEEWKISIITKLEVVKIDPKIIGLKDPNFEIMIPDVGPNNNNTMANGNWTRPVSIGLSENPIGFGVCIKIGIVWKTINIEKPTIIIIVLGINIWGLMKILKSINGDLVCFST